MIKNIKIDEVNEVINKAKDIAWIRSLSLYDQRELMNVCAKHIYKLRSDKTLGTLKNTSLFNKLRKIIARIYTVTHKTSLIQK